MTVEQKRKVLSGAYPSASWAEKVRRMPEDQVVAIYLRLKAQDKI